MVLLMYCKTVNALILVLGVVADEEELVAKLGEVGLDAFAHLPEHNGKRPGFLLVGARRGLEADVGRLKQVKLHFGAEVPLVADDAAVVVLQLDVVQVIDVMHVGRRDVVGVEHAARSCQPVQLVAVVMLPLGSAVAV